MRRLFVVALLSLLTPLPAVAGVATLTRAGDGHFWAAAKVNGRPTKMLVDTGASVVALNREDAKRARIDVNRLRYNVIVDTAGGRAMGARVTLDEITIGGATVTHVDAMVMEQRISTSVLGMSFLKRLSRMDVRGDEMRLKD